MQVNGVFGNTPDNRRITPQSSARDNSSIFISLDRTDSKIDATDIQYSNDKAMELAAPYFAFLVSYCDGNHEWTPFMLEMVTTLIEAVNSAYENYNEDYTFTITEFGTMVLTDESGNPVLDVKTGDKGVLSAVDYKNNKEIGIKEHRNNTTRISEFALSEETNERTGMSSEKSYRTDESLYEINSNGTNEIYNRSGQLIRRTYTQHTDEGNFLVKEKYRNNTLSCREIYVVEESDESDVQAVQKLQNRVVYGADGQEITVTEYRDNKVVSFVDNRTKNGNEYFDESKLDGQIDSTIRQGLSGICYMVSLVNSMYLSYNSEHIEKLNSAITYDFDNKVEKVEFKGLGLTYEIPMEDIETHMTRFGLNDPDFPAIVLAYERFLSGDYGSDLTPDESDTIYNNINEILTSHGMWPSRNKTINSGSPAELYFALTGEVMHSGKLNEGNNFDNAKESLGNGGIVNASTPHYSINSSENYMAGHNYAVLEIDEENDRVVLFEPNLEEYKYPTIAEFKREFEGIYYTRILSKEDY